MNTTTQSNRRYAGNNGEFKQYLSIDKKFGYLHEVREVPNSSPKVYAARISVPLGQGQNTQYLTLELYIKSAEALVLFFDHSSAIKNDDVKVTIRFSCNNIFPRAYIAKNGQHEGDIISYLSGNLSFVHTMKINGDVVHGNQNSESTASASNSGRYSNEGPSLKEVTEYEKANTSEASLQESAEATSTSSDLASSGGASKVGSPNVEKPSTVKKKNVAVKKGKERSF